MESATATFLSDLTRDEEWIADLAPQEDCRLACMLADANLTPAEASAYKGVMDGTAQTNG